MKYKLAVIDANAPLLPFYSQIDRNLFEVYGFAWADGAVCKKFCDKFYPISFTEKDEILKICKELQIDGITSFSLESAVPTVIYVAHHLGLPTNTLKVAEWVGNKNRMRELLTAKHVGYSPKFFSVKEVQEVEKHTIDYPVIVKPDDGGGSRGVSLVYSKDELIEALNLSFDNSRTKKVIVEEYVEGDEFSVEYISYNGKHYFLAITDKTTSGIPHFIELKHHQPTKLSAEMAERVKSVVEKALTVLGISDSPSHTEVRINKNGEPTIIEIGPRMGGDCITSHLVRLSTGYDFVNNNCKMVCGEFVEPKYLAANPTTVLFYSPYTKEEFENLIKNNNSLLYKDLKEYSATCNNNSERSGCAIYKD